MHRDYPTLSAAEARIQSYEKPSRLGTSLAAVDGHDVYSALPCPWLRWMATTSIVPCRVLCAARRLLSPPSRPLELSRSLPLTPPGPVFACLGRHPLSGSPEGFRPDRLPSPG